MNKKLKKKLEDKIVFDDEHGIVNIKNKDLLEAVLPLVRSIEAEWEKVIGLGQANKNGTGVLKFFDFIEELLEEK